MPGLSLAERPKTAVRVCLVGERRIVCPDSLRRTLLRPRLHLSLLTAAISVEITAKRDNENAVVSRIGDTTASLLQDFPSVRLLHRHLLAQLTGEKGHRPFQALLETDRRIVPEPPQFLDRRIRMLDIADPRRVIVRLRRHADDPA